MVEGWCNGGRGDSVLYNSVPFAPRIHRPA
jgi:hypothetical protein